MKKDNQILKVTKWIISIRKEKIWLEQMAQSGWILSDMKMGIRYTFTKSEPKRLIYEVDRFNLPKNPTLEEIKHKKEFMSMAEEMGWKVLLYDEDLNYYFCKEYREDEINELYNDFESRQYRAQKYQNRYKDTGAIMIKCALFMAFFGIVILVSEMFSKKMEYGFLLFIMIYEIFCLGCFFLFEYLGSSFYKDFMLTSEEYEEQCKQRENIKNIYKLNISYKGIRKFLEKQSKKGYHLIGASTIKYKFIKGETKEYIYSIDTQSLANKRMKAMGGGVFRNSKDWNGLDNDWQIKSLQEAENKNWSFVCAIMNLVVIYRNQDTIPAEPLNNEKQEKGIYCLTHLGKMGGLILLGALFGFCLGFITSYMGV